MESVFFSIILPTYNRADFLPRAIESVIKQSFTNWELIIVDDGSTDSTQELVNEYSEKDSRIKCLFQKNQERSVARNNGINQAQGKYICFLDSDDEYLTNHLFILNKQVNDKKKIGLYFTNYQTNKNKKIKCLSPDSYLNVSTFFFKNPVTPIRVCLHHSILAKYKFDPKISFSEDMLLWLEVCKHFPIIHINKVTVQYNLHSTNSVNLINNNYSKMLNILETYLKEKKHLFSEIDKKIEREVYSEIYFGIAKYYCLTSNNTKVIKYLIKSILKDLTHEQTKFRLNILQKLIRGVDVRSLFNIQPK